MVGLGALLLVFVLAPSPSRFATQVEPLLAVVLPQVAMHLAEAAVPVVELAAAEQAVVVADWEPHWLPELPERLQRPRQTMTTVPHHRLDSRNARSNLRRWQ